MRAAVTPAPPPSISVERPWTTKRGRAAAARMPDTEEADDEELGKLEDLEEETSLRGEFWEVLTEKPRSTRVIG